MTTADAWGDATREWAAHHEAQGRVHNNTIERLQLQLEHARSDARDEYARAEQAEQALVAARAEIAALKRLIHEANTPRTVGSGW